jgi:large subunit ribosomal protein L25
MDNLFELVAEARQDVGKGASRRLRRAERVPAIVYGGDAAPISITFEHKEIKKHLKHEAFYSHILTLTVGKEKQQVVLKTLQRHPYKPVVMHIDFQRVNADVAIHIKVPLHFIGDTTCPGAVGGGTVAHHLTNIEVTCLPKDLPEFIEVDVSALELDQSIHLSQLKLPAGVSIHHLDEAHDASVVSVHVIRESAEDLAADAAEAEIAAHQHTEAVPEEGAAAPAATPASEVPVVEKKDKEAE